MENNEIQNVSRGGTQSDLANDVAMLFSWAKIQNAPYRDFSRLPKRSPSPPVHTDAASSSATAASPVTASANIDVCSPELRPLSSSDQATPVEHQASSSHDPVTRPSLQR